ncbi:MAG TPA: right-handed parallel beta-helix repeat-containing protein [Solirubrobacterales bacterium]|nr:right-handed parallel beta-helix repeat-containing protein [Solirubrobacterales bacterium]
MALCVVACALPAGAGAVSATRYVAPGGSDAANACADPAAPCATIQHAVDAAVAGDTIEIAAGTYAEQVSVGKTLALRGPNAGIDPNAEARGAEAIVEGGGGIAIRPDAERVSIEGLTVSASDTGEPIYTGVGDTDGLTIADDVVGSGVRAITIETAGEGISIEHDLIEGAGYGVMLAEGAYSNLTIDDDVFPGPVDDYTIFNPGNSTFEGLELRGNTVRDTAAIGGSVTEGVVAGNDFDVDRPGEMGLQIDLHESSLTGNSFDGNGTTGCLQIFGSQFGLDPSAGVTVSGNDFHDCNAYGIQLSPDVERVTIADNTIVDSYDGVDTRDIDPWDPTGRQIEISANRIVGSTHMGVANTVGGTLEAPGNWWGCNGGPTLDGSNPCDTVSAGVDASPWLVLRVAAAHPSFAPGGSSTVEATIDTDSAGNAAAPPPDGVPVAFSTDLGTVAPDGATLLGGTATTLLSSAAAGVATVTATVDGQAVSVPVDVRAPEQSVPPRQTSAPPASGATAGLVPLGEGGPLAILPGGRVKIATAVCPHRCRIAIQARNVRVGRHRYGISLQLRQQLSPGEQAPVWAILPRKARRALLHHGRAQATVRLRFWSAHVRMAAVHLALKPPAHP